MSIVFPPPKVDKVLPHPSEMLHQKMRLERLQLKQNEPPFLQVRAREFLRYDTHRPQEHI